MSGRFTERISVALATAAGVCVLAAVLLFRDQLPLSRSAARVVGFGVLYGGMALFLWAAFHLKGAMGGRVAPCLDRLVLTGPYRFVRHPAYAAMAVSLIGASVATRSAAGLLVTAVLFVPAEIHRARLEEQALEEEFGDMWKAYAARTGFFFPRVNRRRPA